MAVEMEAVRWRAGGGGDETATTTTTTTTTTNTTTTKALFSVLTLVFIVPASLFPAVRG